jgi:hypothetical protein
VSTSFSAGPLTSWGRDGIEVQAKGAYCWTFRDGVIIRGLFSNEFGEALEAAGLRE